MYGGTRAKKPNQRVRIISVLMLLLAAGVIGMTVFSRHHFSNGTTINGVDCSFCTPEGAMEKLEQAMNRNINVHTLLPNGEGKLYSLTAEEIQSFGIKAPDVQAFEELLCIQNSDWKQIEFELNQNFTLNQDALRDYLKTVPELGKNMVAPKNAYLKMGDDGRLEIVPEVYGNLVDFEEAFELAVSTIEKGESEIFISKITQTDPDISVTAKSLQNAQKKINQVLDSVLKFTLPDGTIVTLDVEIMKYWVTQSPDGSFSIDIEENLSSFIDFLNEKVKESSKTITFESTGAGEVTFDLPDYAKIHLDKEKQVAEAKRALLEGTSKEMELYLIDPLELYKNSKTYIELDKTRQTVWDYVNGEDNLEGAECVTGNESTNSGTPIGIYFLTYKTRNAVLRGYNRDGSRYASPVKYWMPFNGGIGFHDASWRHGRFGGKIYITNGSHGCVNMTEEDAAILYEDITTEVPIFIYAS